MQLRASRVSYDTRHQAVNAETPTQANTHPCPSLEITVHTVLVA